MLARLTPGFFLLALAAVVAACSSTSTTPSSGGVPGIGPNFAPKTVYVADTTGQAIEIFAPNPAAGSIPQFAIGGSNTTMNGPQYLAFDANKNLLVTNYNAAQGTTSILQFATYATGNVLPVNSSALTFPQFPHGLAAFPGAKGFAVAVTNPGNFFNNEVLIYTAGSLATVLAGNNTQLNVPIGLAIQGTNTIFVSNSGTPSVTIYTTPTPMPTPSTTPSPVPTPTATPTPVGATPSPTPAPTATPTPSSYNAPPNATIAGAATQLKVPLGITLDSAGNLYVADAGQPTPRVLVFNAPFGAGVLNIAPSRSITSASLIHPNDVKVDSSGLIYVTDSGAGPNGTSKLLIFAANANGFSSPLTIVALPGTGTGLALSP